jgi:Ni,Fe-hydrogenase I cytochrome b subunit
MQKMAYAMFLVMMVAQALTGLFIWRYQVPILSVSLYGVTASLLGGTGVWAMRTVHYILNWLFIILTTVHLYLAAHIDMPCTMDFFGIKPMDVHPGGHGEAHDDVPAQLEPQVEPTTA